MEWPRSFVWLILLSDLLLIVVGNSEGEALTALKESLSDPTDALQSWDNQNSVSPCTWFHITCNPENRVVRVDLGNAKLSGKLVPQLGQLPDLQYLELYSNNITGEIPKELGDLRELVSLDLYQNRLTGPIPSSLGKLDKLRFLRLNNNNLSGEIPLSLTAVSLQVLDVSNNQLNGDIPVNGSFSLFTPISFGGNNLRQPPASPPPPVSTPPPSPPVSKSRTAAAVAGGVAAGAAVLFACPAIAFAWWLRRRPQDRFFDVPAEENPEVHLGQLRRFSLRELLVATDNFSNKNVLGRGGFGKVYKGRLADGSLVAVKRLKEERTQGGELQFQTEIEMISMAVHRNLLRLRGFCMTPTERLLVKEVLKEKKYESLVDAELEGKYVEKEVEQLIQMALLCTQSSSLERPKMSEVVRMLEGEGLAEKWEEWQNEEILTNDSNYPTEWFNPISNSIIENDYPSGPR
ncbi:hypothetical protein Bca4012_009282 [Brassica carinata]